MQGCGRRAKKSNHAQPYDAKTECINCVLIFFFFDIVPSLRFLPPAQ